MEIQTIPGFQLASRTVTPADGRPPSSKIFRHRGAHNLKFRSPADSRTIDFRRGLETYVPPRIARKPNSSQGQRKQRSKTPVQNVGKENEIEAEGALDFKEMEKEIGAMKNADLRDDLSQGQASNTGDTGQYQISECGVTPLSTSPPGSSVADPSLLCTCDGAGGMENKRHGDPSNNQQSKAWFEKTLQEYEDLKKSVEAHISSTPSDRSEIAADVHQHCSSHVWEEIHVQDKTFSDSDILDADKSSRKPAFTSNSSMVGTVSQLQETNKALQKTVKEVRERQYTNKPYDVGALAESKIENVQCTGMSLYEPQLRKKVLSTLKNSVQRMETLMIALRDEQEKSKNLSLQLQGFLSASKDRTPLPTPPRSAPWSRSTSPEPSAGGEMSMQQCHFLPPPAHLVSPRGPSRAKSPESSSARTSSRALHHRQNLERIPSPLPIICEIEFAMPKKNLQRSITTVPTPVLPMSIPDKISVITSSGTESQCSPNLSSS